MEEAHEILVARLEEESGDLRASLEDAFEPERVRYDLTLDLVDSTDAVLRRLPPPESDVSFLYHQEGDEIRCRRVGPMAALILEAAFEPASLDEIVTRVAEAAGIAQPGEELAGKVRAQLRELYGADLVGVVGPR